MIQFLLSPGNLIILVTFTAFLASPLEASL